MKLRSPPPKVAAPKVKIDEAVQASSHSPVIKPGDEINNFVPADIFDKTTKQLSNILYAVVFVLLIGYAGIFVASLAPVIDAWRFKTSAYQELVTKITEQNIKVDFMYQQISSQKKERQCK